MEKSPWLIILSYPSWPIYLWPCLHQMTCCCFFNYVNKKILYFIWNDKPNKIKPTQLYNEYEFREQKWNIKALDLSLKASVIQKLYLNLNWFSSRLVIMAHQVFKNGPFPFIQITTFHFQLYKNEIISKILLFLKQATESWLQFQFNPPEKREQIW